MVSYLDELRLPGVKGEGADFGEVYSKAPGGNKTRVYTHYQCQVCVSARLSAFFGQLFVHVVLKTTDSKVGG